MNLDLALLSLHSLGIKALMLIVWKNTTTTFNSQTGLTPLSKAPMLKAQHSDFETWESVAVRAVPQQTIQ